MKKNSGPEGVTGFPKTAHADESHRSSSLVKLPTELGVEQADSLRETLVKHMDDVKSVTLDAAEVQRIHTAALQLFCMFCKDRRAAGYETTWHQPSAALRSAAALLGATTLLRFGQDQEPA